MTTHQVDPSYDEAQARSCFEYTDSASTGIIHALLAINGQFSEINSNLAEIKDELSAIRQNGIFAETNR